MEQDAWEPKLWIYGGKTHGITHTQNYYYYYYKSMSTFTSHGSMMSYLKY